MLLKETTLPGCSCNANFLCSEHLNKVRIWWPQIHLSMSYLVLVVKHRQPHVPKFRKAVVMEGKLLPAKSIYTKSKKVLKFNIDTHNDILQDHLQ